MSQLKASLAGERVEPTRWLWTLLVLGLGTAAHALSVQTLLEDSSLASSVMSSGLWQQLVRSLGGNVVAADGAATARLELTSIFIPELGFAVAAWLAGGWCIAHGRRSGLAATLCDWGQWGWLWWFVPGVWELLRVLAFETGFLSLANLLIATTAMWQAMMLAGWITTGCWRAGRQRLEVRGQRSEVSGQSLAPQSADHDPRSTIHHSPLTTHHSPPTTPLPCSVWLAMAAYFVTFAAMNVGLWNSLLIPHGDSAMYEEHLWNLLHGKGFRSYLDNGRLFLGEHVQVIHLLLIPLYVLWPSHVLLELCQSLALALGAIPVFRLAERHTGSRRAGTLLAIAYLLYFPMQFLDIAIDLKTFRPNSFEIPFLLFALDALERGRTRSLLAWLLLMLLCQEDAAPVIAPLGVWIAVRGYCRLPIADCRLNATPGSSAELFNRQSETGNRKSVSLLGWGLALFGVVYTILVIKVVLPYFRGGADVHFAQYFSDLGGSSGEIVRNAFSRPGLFLGRFFNVESAVFALALLLPVGFMSLLSPGRLAVGVPLFAVLCLSPITNRPYHHFHAALVPIVFWSAAAGLGSVPGIWNAIRLKWRRGSRIEDRGSPVPAERRIRSTAIRPTERNLPVAPENGGSKMEDRDAAVLGANLASSILEPPSSTSLAATWAMTCSLAMGLFISLSPLGITFWDPHSSGFWRRLYVPGPRAKLLPRVLAQIPTTSRVASTDFVHPRFTHHERSYDYSDYRPIVPDDTEYIVIDTQHPYSTIKRPDDVKELREQPDAWQLAPDETGGYFIVLKRKPR